MEDIKTLINDLDWSKPEQITRKAMQELLNVNEEEAILLANQSQDICNKPCWHNASLVLKEIGYPKNRLTLPYLMNWFQDINWPGVLTIIELLKDIDEEILKPYIWAAMEKALVDNDESWAWGILFLLNSLNIYTSSFEENDLIYNLIKLSKWEES